MAEHGAGPKANSQPALHKVQMWLHATTENNGSTGENSSRNISYWLHHYFLEIGVEFSAFRWKWS